MAEKSKTTEADSKVFDVAKPGTSTPDTGSKPMVVGHKSITIDPTIKAAEDSPEIESGEKISVGTKAVEKKIIAPIISETPKKDKLADDVSPDVPIVKEDVEPELAEENTAPDVADTEDIKSEEEETVSAPVSQDVKSDTTTAIESAETKSADDSNFKDKNTDTEELGDVKTEAEQEFEELISSKKYFLDIKPARKGGVKNLLLFLLVLLLALIGAYALADAEIIPGSDLLPKRFMENTSISETVEAPAASIEEVKKSKIVTTKLSDVDENSLGFNIPMKYSLDAPDTWVLEKTSVDAQDNTYNSDVYSLPSGAKLTIFQDPGGKGGDCTPAESDTPHTKGNLCPTLEYISKDEIDIDPSDLMQSKTANTKTYLVERRFTGVDGVSKYSLCVEVNDDNYNPTVGKPLMGFYISNCGPAIALTESPAINVEITGVENDSLEYFDDNDVMDIKEVLKTFKLL